MAEKEFSYEYNPVKELKGGTEASKVVWSTKSLNAAVDALKKGLPLKANPFCGTNTMLLKPDLVYKRTEEEVEDYIKCMQDPLYFAEKCFLMTPKGLQPVKMRDYQKEYLTNLKENRFNILLACRQAGKTQLIDSQIVVRINNTDITDDMLKKSIYNKIDDGENYILSIPLFELYNIYSDRFINKCRHHLYKLRFKLKHNDIKRNIITKCISLIDFIDYKFIKKEHLTDNYKTIEEIELDKSIEILTDTGFSPVSRLMLSKPFDIYKIRLENGYWLECADEHIVFDTDFNEIYVDQLHTGDYIQTDQGLQKIISIEHYNTKVCMGDITVDDDNHRFYSNGILSHNSVTTAIFGLWKILFCNDRNGLILSKSGPAGRDLLKKVKDMYMYLPYHLKAGTMKWNQSEISFDNNSSLSTEAFGPTAALGKSLNLIILDEFAWCPQNDVDLFYENVIPTVTTLPDSNVCICSTQNGFNKFYEIWKSSVEGRSIYHHQKIDWWQVPNYNLETGQWEPRTEEWKQMMIGVLGSEEAFYYQYGTQFSASDACLVSRETLTKIHQTEILFTAREELVSSLYSKFLFVNPEYDVANFKNKYYIVLVDLAEGGGADYTVFQILEVKVNSITGKVTFEQVAFWRSNTVDIEKAAVEFWVMMGQLFRTDLSNVIISIEWNTYGALFYNYICLLNETENFKDSLWRFNFCKEFDTSVLCHYKKANMNEEIAGIKNKNAKTIPGIRWSAESKKTGCAMLKMMIEKGELIIRDIVQIGELENFEDKTGSGSYKASYGHDDMMMTLVQLPMVLQTGKYKEFIEDISERSKLDSLGELQSQRDFNFGDMAEVGFQQSNTTSIFSDYTSAPW